MSICISGLHNKIDKNETISIKVSSLHPLIKLSNSIDWNGLHNLALPDIKKSTNKLKWWLSRQLKIRIHPAVFLLQQLLNQTDRGIEKAITYNALYQVFFGKTIVKNWVCPDHTKTEEFRSRLSPETQCSLSNAIAKIAVKYQFAKPEHIDIDSTVQEPDMRYPATAHLLFKTAIIAKRIHKLCFQWLPEQDKKITEIDLKKMKGIAKEYYFIKRKQMK